MWCFMLFPSQILIQIGVHGAEHIRVQSTMMFCVQSTTMFCAYLLVPLVGPWRRDIKVIISTLIVYSTDYWLKDSY